MKRRFIVASAAVALVIVGFSLFFYGFELVSVPHVHEYNEPIYTIIGALFILAGIGTAFFASKKRFRPDRPASPPPES